MAENGDKAPPPRKKKKHDHGHHGGAWKVAFADFMTSMFALFLVLWIISSTSAEQKEAIAQYFQNPTIFKSGSSSPMNMGGATATKEKQEGGSNVASEEGKDDQTLKTLDSVLASDSALASLGEQFQTRMTEKGLEIEISDAAGLGTFEIGSAAINPKMYQALEELGNSLGGIDNRLVISGHTDAYEYTNGYSNWQLSADRANSVRQYLASKGVDPLRVNSVIGSGDREPKNPTNPYAPENRRVTLLILKKGESLTPKDAPAESETPVKKPSGSTGFRPLGEIREHPAKETAPEH